MLFGQPAGDDAHRFAVLDVPVTILHEQTAEHASEVAFSGCEGAAIVVGENPQRGARPQGCQRIVVVIRRVDDVCELLGDPAAERSGHRSVDRADHPERRQRVGRERALVGLLDRRGDGDSARVGVLDDHTRRQRELPEEQQGSIQVVEVDERKLLAAELLDLRE